MKNLFFFLLVVLCCSKIFGQGMGIGTNTPNPSALLELKSSNKGLLLPRMTTFDRVLIPSPANGLLVYDSTLNRIFQYQNGEWRYFINDNYWKVSSTKNWVYNSTDSVGVGLSAPTQRMDVNGNIRSRDDIMADGKVVAQGLVSANGLQSSGGLSVVNNGLIGGSFTANGNLSTNSELSINNTGATFQLKTGGVDKGFVQLAGDNLRLGTNSSNADGRIIFRSGGVDRMTFFENGSATIGGTTGAPANIKLRVQGDISVDSKVFTETLSASEDIIVGGKVKRLNTTLVSNFLPLCYGSIRSGVLRNTSGNVSTNWIWDSGSCGGVYFCSGYYTITNPDITANSTITVTPNIAYGASNQNYIYSTSAWCEAGKATVRIQLHIMLAKEIYYPKEDFSFVIYE